MNAEQSTFKRIKTADIASLNLRYEEYQHLVTRARHIHLHSDSKENVFLVALRTVPTDSTGVAHILEHTSLCGSKKFPVRDPFFMMIRRSLNTFMNAFTSSDWTAYPFASQNRKDFDNLLEVYLDAVFFARLDPLDFAQEGHRIEFSEPGDASSPLEFKGVVFNEMKGAMSSISSQLWQAVGKALFPDTTYGHNSGGDPAAIPDLSYEQLQAFYQTHYHPDNAVFMTFGDIPAARHQQQFEQLALRHFKPQQTTISVSEQTRFAAPVREQTRYPLVDADSASDKTHLLMAWKLNTIKDPFELLATHLLSSILLQNSASPLQHALETTELGNAPSPLCGVDDTGLEMVFVCGIEGSEASQRDAFETLVLDTLQNCCDNPPGHQQLQALLDQIELQQREISGDSYPYGLQLMLSSLPAALHGGDPAAALDLDPVLAQLREAIARPDFVSELVHRLLLDNPHRLTLVMAPDVTLADAMQQAETERLAQIKSSLSDAQKTEIINTAAALLERQAQQDDPGVLPKVELSDIPEHIEVPDCLHEQQDGRNYVFYPQGTNGLVYQQLVSPLPALDDDEMHLLGYYSQLATELGVGERDYLQTQNWHTEVCGGISAYASVRSELEDEQATQGLYTFSAKGLNSHASDIDELLRATRAELRFDEQQRIREIIAQSRARAEQSLTGNGHGLAMAVACQAFSPVARLNHSRSGMLGIARLKKLDDSLQDEDALRSFADQLSHLHNKICTPDYEQLVIGDEPVYRELLANANQQMAGETDAAALVMPGCRETTRELWTCNTQINFCAKAYPTVPSGHQDAPALTVLAGLLRNGYLHTAIREQGGAYGGGASQDSSIAAFRFYSYRDPRIAGTLDDFDKAIDWMLSSSHSWQVIEEAILGVISSLDKPSSPAGTARQHYYNQRFGRSIEHQAAFRNAVLAVREEDLKRVTAQYLQPENASIGIVTHSGEADQYQPLCEQLGIEQQQL